MNKSKLSIAAASRFLLNAFLVLTIVLLASLVGVGGAALWIYGRPVAAPTTTQHSSPHLKVDVAAGEACVFPKLSPIQSDDDTPAQLTPARYVPSDSEIATLSDTPRYINVSYNGGREQAHLSVRTVLNALVPEPLVAPLVDGTAAIQTTDHPLLTNPSSRYITDAHGRIIGIDGTAGAVAEARAELANTARTMSTQPADYAPEIRVAYPVVTRKALSVDGNTPVASPASFDAQAELASDDARPVLRAIPVVHSTRSARPSMFGASDSFRSFGNN